MPLESVIHAAKVSNSGEFIEKLDNQFDTQIGEDGITLSGGQRQRVVIARALVVKPKIIIADEPVSMLDVSIRAEILELMNEIQKKNKISFIYITHDLATAKHFADRIIILYEGKIVETGNIKSVLREPKHQYTKALIDAVSEPDPENLYKEKKISWQIKE